MSFYEDISSQYDDIVDTAARTEGAKRFIAALAPRHSITGVLDVACGTGLYARAAAEAGAEAPATAAADAVPAFISFATPRGTITWRVFVVVVPLVLAPLPDVAQHVV